MLTPCNVACLRVDNNNIYMADLLWVALLWLQLQLEADCMRLRFLLELLVVVVQEVVAAVVDCCLRQAMRPKYHRSCRWS